MSIEERQEMDWAWIMEEDDLDKRSELIVQFNKDCLDKDVQLDLAWQERQAMLDRL